MGVTLVIISIRTFCQIKTIEASLLIGLEGLLEYPDAFKRFQTLETFKTLCQACHKKF